MGYDITIARISDDLKEGVQINEQEWIDCQVEGKIEYKKQEFHPNQFLEQLQKGSDSILGLNSKISPNVSATNSIIFENQTVSRSIDHSIWLNADILIKLDRPSDL